MAVCLTLTVPVSGWQVAAPVPSGPAPPREDMVTVRGCLEGTTLRVIEHDATDLSGVHSLRLKLSKSMRELIRCDPSARYLEVTGTLDLGRPDRADVRAKKKIGKTTVFVTAAQEQRDNAPQLAPDPILIVDGVIPLGETCTLPSGPSGDRPEGGRAVNPPQSVTTREIHH
jgi:hypothetical protein